MTLTKQEIDASWDSTCADVRAGIAMGLEMGVKPKTKGQSNKEARIEFCQELAKLAFEAGVRLGAETAKVGS